MENQRQIGREYEKMAAEYLEACGFRYFPVIIGADTGRLS